MKALICGIGGQDGAYLARHLLAKGYEVWGTSRDAQLATFDNLRRLGIRDRVTTLSMATNDFRSVLQALTKCQPTEVYNLAGQTSVGLSFEQPTEALESTATATLNLLEVIRFLGKPIRFYQAGSSECFGDVGEVATTETYFEPRSPYAVAKSTAHWLVVNYRDAYGLYACNGILFNHESPLRPPRFVTREITQGAVRIARGAKEKLVLGDLGIRGRQGLEPRIRRRHVAHVAGRQTTGLRDRHRRVEFAARFRAAAFAEVHLDWRDHMVQDAQFFRPTEIRHSRGDASKAETHLGWKASMTMRDVARLMVQHELDPAISL